MGWSGTYKTNSYLFEEVPNCVLYLSGLCSGNRILVQNILLEWEVGFILTGVLIPLE